MKLKIIFLFVTSFTSILNAQLSAVDYKSKDFEQFRGSKTHVVLTGDKKFDSEIKSAMTDLWKVTPIEFISDSEFDNKISDKTASFISLLVVVGAKNNYHYLGLINGGQKKRTRYKYDDMLAYCPINFYQNENNLVDCNYRVRNMVQSMVQSMEIVQKNDIRGSSYGIVKDLQKYYNTKSYKIKERTLLFCDETLGNKLTNIEVSGFYPFKFEICNKQKIEQVIKDKSTDYYYFQPGITLNKSMFVFDPSNGEVVYFEFSIMGLNINKGNIKDLVEAINKSK